MDTTAQQRERTLAGLLDMTGQVLRCRHVDESRRVALEHLRRLFDATSAAFVLPNRPILFGPADALLDGPVRELPEVYAHYLHEDPGLPVVQRLRQELRPAVVTTREMYSDGRLVRSRFYNDVLRRFDMHHGMGLLVAAEERPLGVIVLWRGRDQGPFTAWETATGLSAARVLATAFASIGRGEQRDAEAPQTVAVLDEKLALLYRDTSGPAHLTRWLAGPWQQDAGLDGFLARCRAVLDGAPPPPEFTLAVRTADGGSTELVVELRRIARPGSVRLVLLLRQAPIGHDGATVSLRLSRREREVANLIVSGASHAEIAARLAVSMPTVAHHARAAYRKTRVGNRAALAARLSGTTLQPDAIPGLTARERDIAARLLDGARNKEIAAQLGLSAATISNHLQNIYRKAGVHGRIALIRLLVADSSAGG